MGVAFVTSNVEVQPRPKAVGWNAGLAGAFTAATVQVHRFE